MNRLQTSGAKIWYKKQNEKNLLRRNDLILLEVERLKKEGVSVVEEKCILNRYNPLNQVDVVSNSIIY